MRGIPVTITRSDNVTKIEIFCPVEYTPSLKPATLVTVGRVESPGAITNNVCVGDWE